MKSLHLTIWLLIIAVTTAYGNNSYDNSLQYDSVSLHKEVNLTNQQDESAQSMYIDINFLYPKGSSSVTKKIRQSFINYFSDNYSNKISSPISAVNAVVNKCKEFYKSNDNVLECQDPTIYLYNKIVFEDDNIVSIQKIKQNMQQSELNETTSVSISKKDGSIIKEKDIFVPDYEEKLKSIIINNIMERYVNDIIVSKAEVDSVALDEYRADLANIEISDNFHITNKGVDYEFNEINTLSIPLPYEIPYEDLFELINKNSIVYNLYIYNK